VIHPRINDIPEKNWAVKELPNFEGVGMFMKDLDLPPKSALTRVTGTCIPSS
jgi:hypothetical protein